MSHFTTIKTVIKDLKHLKNALNDMNVEYIINDNHLVIPQKNNISLDFSWNGKSYDLIVDLQFWQQSLSFEGFMQKLQKYYSYYSIIEKTESLGFVTTEKVQTNEGKYKLTLQNYLK